jgi:hypothetical protein
MKPILTYALLILTAASFGQNIKFQGGTSFSKIYHDNGRRRVTNTGTSVGYSFFVGADYMDKTYFNLSSNIGLIRKGSEGMIIITNSQIAGDVLRDPLFEYISANTIIELKCPTTKKFFPFISVGPRADYLISDVSPMALSINLIGSLQKISYGLLLGGGLKYELAKFQFGLRSEYYLNFNSIAKAGPTDDDNGRLYDKTFTLNGSFAYKLL